MDATLGFLTLFIGFCVTLVVAQRNRAIATILLVAFSMRTALTLVDSFLFRLPGASDGIWWDIGAAYMARDGVAGTFQYMRTGHFFYKFFIAFMYALFDRSPLMVKGINVLLGTLMVKTTWQLSVLLGRDERRGRVVAWLMALCPSLIYFSSVLLREVAVAYPLLLSIVYLTRWYEERKNWQILAAIAALIISMIFHSGSVAVLLFGGIWLVGNWFRSIVAGHFRHLGRNTLALALGVAVVIAVLASGFGLDKFNGLEAGGVDTLTTRQEGFAHGRTAYLEDLHAGSPLDLVWQAPIRIVYFLFAPFPWMLSSGSDLFGVLDSLLFAALVVQALRHRRDLVRAPRIMVVLGVFSAMAMVFAIGVSNYGTALRHRNKMLPLLIAAVISIPVERKRKALAAIPPDSPLFPAPTRALAAQPRTSA